MWGWTYTQKVHTWKHYTCTQIVCAHTCKCKWAGIGACTKQMGAHVKSNTTTHTPLSLSASSGTFITIQSPLWSASVSIVTPTHTQTTLPQSQTHMWYTQAATQMHPHTQTHSGQLSDVESVHFSSACVKVSHLSFHSFITPCKGKHCLSLPQPLQMEREMRYTAERKWDLPLSRSFFVSLILLSVLFAHLYIYTLCIYCLTCMFSVTLYFSLPLSMSWASTSMIEQPNLNILSHWQMQQCDCNRADRYT